MDALRGGLLLMSETPRYWKGSVAMSFFEESKTYSRPYHTAD